MSTENTGNRFWQINLGHVVTIVSILITLGSMYSRLSVTLENQGASLAALENRETHLEENQTAMAIADAATAKDLADVHTNMEQDLVRRLNHDEDVIEELRTKAP